MDSLIKYTLLLGSNQGDSIAYLMNALGLIEDTIGSITAKTTVHQTAAWGKTDQPDFYNMALEVETALAPLDLLDKTQAIEKKLGRVRTEKWGPRTLDIDILYCGDMIFVDERLTIPHPYLHQRKFTLDLLVELNPDFVHPVLGKTNTELQKAV
ncbi:MAG: 2-amino-4-hydroxy-6-hydroxymethyldihydropteridine diphosphokinase [Bacteroidota bacterium]